MAQINKSALRAQLLQQRENLTSAQRKSAETIICRHLQHWLHDKNYACVGAYWPIRSEVDIRPLLEVLTQRRIVALPISQRDQPLNFVRWQAEQPMTHDAYKIPVPSAGEICHPNCLLIPCIGFDSSGYRLGYGAGFYDYTLDAWKRQGLSRPVLIGVSFACGKIASGFHQAHDVALDLIVTEEGVMQITPS